ncbi:glycosyltransferase family protein [Pedobacter boryungensis]|uniref:Glycosyltransferase 2-like domain-containing protein n=1 Tax=Pedobacter boryungensis TaxID=869962 RepID=A0ABX2DIK9_9SPHI|nr:hypothetical protein [Pedobacter boryungensis]NQX32756.1 hypothetical protein [Pedobacter boryungensis]
MIKKNIPTVEFNAFLDSLVVTLVLFKTNLYETSAYITLNKSAKEIAADANFDCYVFDNSPEPNFNDISRLTLDKIKYKYDSSNPGLSKPSNEAAQMGKNAHKKWILFTNPDTSYPLNYFEELFHSVSSNNNIELFVPILKSNEVIVSPAKYTFFIGSSPDSVNPGINNLEKKLILYSGMFITLTAFFKSGGFNDKIKLDFMDCYFSENYKRKYPTFYLLNVNCEHDLSSFEKNVQKVLNRFKYYCEGAKYFASTKINYFSLFVICLLRSFKLATKFQNLSFPKIVFKVFLTK